MQTSKISVSGESMLENTLNELVWDSDLFTQGFAI